MYASLLMKNIKSQEKLNRGANNFSAAAEERHAKENVRGIIMRLQLDPKLWHTGCRLKHLVLKLIKKKVLENPALARFLSDDEMALAASMIQNFKVVTKNENKN